jgi:hypothetical protein
MSIGTIILDKNCIAGKKELGRWVSARTRTEGRALGRVKGRRTPRLNVVERSQRGRLPKRFVR